jgi:hypothetical protein
MSLDPAKKPPQHLEDTGHVDAEKSEQDNVLPPDWTATEKSLVRKLDMTLLPVVWVLYMFNYLDRNNIACVFSYVLKMPDSNILPVKHALTTLSEISGLRERTLTSQSQF